MMKSRLITLLLVTAAAFLFAGEVVGQTNATFSTIDVRTRETFRGPFYNYDTTFFKPSSTNIPFQDVGDPLGWFLSTSKGAEAKLVRVTIGQLRDTLLSNSPFVRDSVNGTIYPVVLTDKIGIGIDTPSVMLEVIGDFQAKYDNTYMGYKVNPSDITTRSLYSGIIDDTTSIIENKSTDEGIYNYVLGITNSIEVGTASIALNGADSTDFSTVNIMAITNSQSSQIYTAPGYVMIASDSISIEGKIVGNNDLSYILRHTHIFFADSTVVLNLTQNVYSKVTNATNTLWDDDEVSEMTFAGDSVTATTAGDYVVWFHFDGTGAGVNDVYKFRLFKNGVAVAGGPTSKGINTQTGWTWYVPLAVNDDLSIRVTNTTDNDDLTAENSVLYIRKEHD